VEWLPGSGDEDSYALSIAAPDHWLLTDCVAVISTGHKATGSTEGHAAASTSPLQVARVADAPRRLEVCRQAILQRDFESFAEIMEHDSDLMHAVMMTSRPALFYWEPATLGVMDMVRTWRKDGLPVAYTIDAGPNVHVICPQEKAGEVREKLSGLQGVSRVLTAGAGGPARVEK
jgi:diphosphomevalonate decarboxylase